MFEAFLLDPRVDLSSCVLVTEPESQKPGGGPYPEGPERNRVTAGVKRSLRAAGFEEWYDGRAMFRVAYQPKRAKLVALRAPPRRSVVLRRFWQPPGLHSLGAPSSVPEPCGFVQADRVPVRVQRQDHAQVDLVMADAVRNPFEASATASAAGWGPTVASLDRASDTRGDSSAS